MKINTPILFVVMFAAATARLGAQTYLLSSPGPGTVYPHNGNTTDYDTVYPIGYYNLGYEFTTGASALSVTALGFYDAGSDGFNYTHDVGLWNTSGVSQASVSIPAGVNSLVNGFAFVSLGTPVTLLANTNYILSAVWNALAMSPQDALRFNQSGSGPTLTGATLVGDRYGAYGNSPASALLFPSSTDWASTWVSGTPSGFTTSPLAGGSGASYIGANMAFTAIPEPSTYAAIAGAAMLGLAVWRRRRRPTTAATPAPNAVA
ncbi:MAG: DUF4082 domain-containing protein [Verrucomicrobia bacterium]|nr:DUF4082 domain-containing protein [Verrucomicrobiota bacterium]